MNALVCDLLVFFLICKCLPQFIDFHLFTLFIYFFIFVSLSVLMVHSDNTCCPISYLFVCNPLTGFSFAIDLSKDFFLVHLVTLMDSK